MKSFTILFFCLLSSIAFTQQASKKTYLITASPSTPLLYNQITSIDINGGKFLEDLYNPHKKYSLKNNVYKSYQSSSKTDEKVVGEEDESKSPLGGSVACMAFDAKSNRLFYVPLQLSELRYLDLTESEQSFTCLKNQSLNLLHNKDDVANQISRMAMGSDGFGYALSNDGEHLIKFSTQGTPVIQDLGVLIDNPTNKIMVRSSCTSWGGDMVGGTDGKLYLIGLYNHVFRINLPSKKCDYLGTIKNLPDGFTSNGASADENGDLVVSCGTTYNKPFSPIYKVKWPSLEASSVNVHISSLGNVSDMASGNLLFQVAPKTVEKSGTQLNFTQTTEIDVVTLPSYNIYPNPITRGRFQIKTTNIKEKGEYKMRLLDVGGQVIMEGRMNLGLKTNSNSFSFPPQNAKGVYFVQIADAFNRTVYSQQLIVE